jgi:Zn finger protein HypA/HybF involved in hydrogenase expression
MRNREKKEKQCLNCGHSIPNRNVYCNNKCQGEYSTKITFKKIENGDTSLHDDTYKRYLIYKYGNKCMKCKWDEVNPTTGLVPIQLEHKDGNSENHDLKNLELLCPNCHSLTSTYGALNKGHGRSKRKEQRKFKGNV